jgi:ATP-dependent protease Clp ATPase subunit
MSLADLTDLVMQHRILKQDVSPPLHIAGYTLTCVDVGDDVENCVLRLLQAAEYDVNRTE